MAVEVRCRGVFACIDGRLADGTTLPLFRAALRRLRRPVGLRDLPRRQRRAALPLVNATSEN
jgi:hypothetical protein